MCVAKYAKIGLPIRKDELKFYGKPAPTAFRLFNDGKLVGALA